MISVDISLFFAEVSTHKFPHKRGVFFLDGAYFIPGRI